MGTLIKTRMVEIKENMTNKLKKEELSITKQQKTIIFPKQTKFPSYEMAVAKQKFKSELCILLKVSISKFSARF